MNEIVEKLSRREFVVRSAGLAALPAALSACKPEAPPAAPAAPVPPPTGAPTAAPLDWGFPDDALRLGLNENPLGPSPRALVAMTEALREGHRYPLSSALQRALAQRHRVEPSWILLGCGSTELLRSLPHAFALPGGEVVTARESYRELSLESQRLGLPTRLVPVDATGAHDLDAMAGAVNERTRIVNVTNPNNPTGSVVPRAAIQRLAERLPAAVTLCVDQAYIEFSPDADASPLIARHPNVLVLQTFSKAHGLAGMRVGYALGHPDRLAALRRCVLRYPLNAAGYAGALAALDDQAHLERYRALRDEARAYFEQALGALGLELRIGPAPFLLARVGRDDADLVRALLERRVYLRSGRDWDLPGWLRISYGTMAQNRRAVEALAQAQKG